MAENSEETRLKLQKQRKVDLKSQTRQENTTR